MKLNNKLILGFLLISIFGAVISFFIASNNFNELNKEIIPRMDIIDSIHLSIIRMLLEVKEFVLIREESSKQEFYDAKTQLFAEIEKYKDYEQSPQYTDFIEKQVTHLAEDSEKIFNAIDTINSLEKNFSNIYLDEKRIRYLIMDEVYNTNDSILNEELGLLIYYSKEALFQYRDEDHFKKWKDSMNNLQNLFLYYPNFNKSVLILLDQYRSNADILIDAIKEIELSNDKLNMLVKETEIEENDLVVNLLQKHNEIYTTIKDQSKKVKKSIIASSFLMIVLGIVFFIVISRSVTKPILNLESAAQNIARGDLTSHISLKTNDELEMLASSLEAMRQELLAQKQELISNNIKLSKSVDELKKIDEMKDNFLSNVSHELHTPITSMKSYNQLMRDGVFGKLSKKQREAVDIIIDSENHLIHLINDLLDVSKYDAHEANFHIMKSDINEIIAGTVKTFKPHLDNIKGKINVKSSNKIRRILFDRDKIIQVINNIISNSIKYRSMRNLVVDISIVQEKQYLKISFKDNGIGMSKKNIKKVFNKFFQVDQGMARGFEGSGLGLYIIKKIILAHKGKIEIKSKLGEGTEVIMKLPINKK